MKRFIVIFTLIVLGLGCLSAGVSAKSDTGAKLVAITFDDGPSKYTEKLLDGLKARHARATFFMVGTNVSRYESTIKRMKDEGHQLATHTMNHANLAKLSASEIQKEVEGVNEKLCAIVGKSEFWLRPPYGSFNSTVKQAVKTPLVIWSLDTEDWKSRNTQAVYQSIINEVRDGDIILLHDLYETSVDAALMAIDTLQDEGYQFVTVEQLLRRRGVAYESGKAYFKARNEGINLPAVAEPVIVTKRTITGTKVIIAKFDKDDITYFTQNGGNPDEKSDRYSGAFYIDRDDAVKAISVNSSDISSMVEEKLSPVDTIPTETLNKSFYRGSVQFLRKKVKFVIGMKF